MTENSKIEWTTHTFNPWRGCTKVAAGCANCYADSQAKRNPKTLGIWGDQGTRVVASETMWREPLKWNAAAKDALLTWEVERWGNTALLKPDRPRVFCASMADVFENWQGQVRNHRGEPLFFVGGGICTQDDCGNIYPGRIATLADVRARLFALIDATPHLDWLLLTKRPENIPAMWSAGECPDCKKDRMRCGHWPALIGRRKNVWLGTSIACKNDLKNIDELRKCRELAPVLFLSAEPLLQDLGDIDLTGIDWVIVGGESGPNARPMEFAWAESLAGQCLAAGVAFFCKQLGGRKDKRGDITTFPPSLQVREFPQAGAQA